MLLDLLKNVFARKPAPPAPGAQRFREFERTARRHEAAPMQAQLELLFGGVSFRGIELAPLVEAAVRDSAVALPALKQIHRRTAWLYLAQYFLGTRALPGRAAECGVFRGTSALLLCRAAQRLQPAYDGAGLHLVDSFEGLSAPVAADRIDGLAGGETPGVARAGALAAEAAHVRRLFAEFPGVRVHQGWIPPVLAGLPEAQWSFVHVDVDLFEPTQAALEYFRPRLVPGGVIVCDDYGSPLFPGAARAWDGHFDALGLPFVVLPTGQAVFLNA